MWPCSMHPCANLWCLPPPCSFTMVYKVTCMPLTAAQRAMTSPFGSRHHCEHLHTLSYRRSAQPSLDGLHFPGTHEAMHRCSCTNTRRQGITTISHVRTSSLAFPARHIRHSLYASEAPSSERRKPSSLGPLRREDVAAYRASLQNQIT
jgi:hypothetical protein